MGFGVKSWGCAALAAALHTLAMFYASIFSVKIVSGAMVLPSSALWAVGAGAVIVIAEYIFFGRKDSGKQLIYRFVQHNLLSFICAYGGYVIYSLGGFQKEHVLNVTVFNVMIPGCIQRYFLISGAAALVCAVIRLVRRRKSKHNAAEE